jgi:RNA polymerase sigma-70 factor (ECF subfamily)
MGPASAATADRNGDDQALIGRVATGDRAALAALYRRHERPLYLFVKSKMNDPFLSNDIVQDVFLEVWRHAARFEGRSTVKGWLYGIAWRKVIDIHRANRRLDYTDILPEVEDEDPGALDRISADEQAGHLRGCLSALKDDHRAAVELAFFHDLGYREIAEALEVPEGTVKTRVFHAKKLLQHCLEQVGIKGFAG